MSRIRVFLAQPVDLIGRDVIRKNVAHVRRLVEALPVEIVAPYLDDGTGHGHPGVKREIAERIVREDYAAIDTCDVFVADLSDDSRQAVGMIFEMSYAETKLKPILVYAGQSEVAQRVWIRAIATAVCETWEEVRAKVEEILHSSARKAGVTS